MKFEVKQMALDVTSETSSTIEWEEASVDLGSCEPQSPKPTF